MTAFSDFDHACMKQALRLARRSEGRVEPNPMVGCVIARGKRVLGTGYHRRFGGPHAEVNALAACSVSPRGATAYITLEPCCYHGKTPPCTTALLDAEIGRVVVATTDPNPSVSGRGITTLRRAGVRVDTRLLTKEANDLIAPFRKLVTRGRPWVILKWAQSLDGKIATRTGDAQWISDENCRAHAHRTRGRVDAIIVGSGTVRLDDPLLTCRVGRPRRSATRVVINSNLRTPINAKLIRTAREFPTWFFAARTAAAKHVRRFEEHGCRVTRVPATATGVSLPSVLAALGRAGMTNVLVEGGGRLLGAFFDKHLVDEYHVYVAPCLIGGREAIGPLDGLGPRRVSDGLQMSAHVRPRTLGSGWLYQWRTAHSP